VASTASTVRSECAGEFPLPSDLSPAGYENMTPPSKPPSPPKKSGESGKKKKKKAAAAPPPEPKIIDAMAPAIGPLQLIGGRYSFSLMDANGDGPLLFRGNPPKAGELDQGGGSPLRAPQVANGKPLFPSLQTAMVTPKEATDGQKDQSKKMSKGRKDEAGGKEKKSKKKKESRPVQPETAPVKVRLTLFLGIYFKPLHFFPRIRTIG
jgi:hypothetical protein